MAFRTISQGLFKETLRSAGDILLAAEAVNALKRGKYTVQLLVKKGFEAAAALAGADRTVPVSFDGGLNRIVEGLNRENYDAVIDLQDNFRSRYISFFFRAGARRVLRKDAVRRRLMVAFKWFMGGGKRVADKYMETLKGIVRGSAVQGRLRIPNSKFKIQKQGYRPSHRRQVEA